MSTFRLRPAIVIAAASAVVPIVLAAPASAVPQCTNTGPTTTQCQTNGSSQINTSPGVTGNDYPFRWPFWGSGISISLGGHGGR